MAPTALDDCLLQRNLPRVARVVGPEGRIVYARVLESRDGWPIRFTALADAQTRLAEVFRLAAAEADPAVEPFAIAASERSRRLCAPVDLPQAAIDAETAVVLAAGLNYAAHAKEAGGGDVFMFPKPASPTGPTARVVPPEGALLDYEVELGLVLLESVDPSKPPDPDTFLAQTAYFVSNDVSDRAPIIREVGFGDLGTGFVEGKGQPGFLPTGPWMVRGSELFAALEACGEPGLGLELFVDAGAGRDPRQSASTALMILEPGELLLRVGAQIEDTGLRTPMPFPTREGERFYPMAVGEAQPRLPAGSVLLTGTPEGVALQAPGVLGVTLRGLMRLRSPFAQFLSEQRERVASGEPGDYLTAGDRVIARIDGLGTHSFEIDPPGTPSAGPGCGDATP